MSHTAIRSAGPTLLPASQSHEETGSPSRSEGNEVAGAPTRLPFGVTCVLGLGKARFSKNAQDQEGKDEHWAQPP
jgi:hypothetical protein